MLAFATVGLELLERAGDTASRAYGEKLVGDMQTKLSNQITRVQPMADTAKAERTMAKVRGMMEQYIGDEWDNPTELLEWSGFYLGAAGIHWSLVAGLAAGTDNKMAAYAEAQAAMFTAWLAIAFTQIKTVRR